MSSQLDHYQIGRNLYTYPLNYSKPVQGPECLNLKKCAVDNVHFSVETLSSIGPRI